MRWWFVPLLMLSFISCTKRDSAQIDKTSQKGDQTNGPVAELSIFQAPISNSRTVRVELKNSRLVSLMKVGEEPNFLNLSWKKFSSEFDYTFQTVGPKTLYVALANASGLTINLSANVLIELFAPDSVSFSIMNPLVISPSAPTFNLGDISHPVNANQMIYSFVADFSVAAWVPWTGTGSISAPLDSTSCKSHRIYLKFRDKDGFESPVAERDGRIQCYKKVSENGAVTPRLDESSVWTGNEMIVWGGWLPDGTQAPGLTTGAIYNPVTDSWRPMSNAPEGRVHHQAVWTGSKMLIWGGKPSDFGGSISTGVLVYDLETDSWRKVLAPGEPQGRYNHSVVWTGTEMIVWGGYYWWFGTTVFGDGARFNPKTNIWTPVSNSNAPSPRFTHLSVWQGTEMIVWGGWRFGNPNTTLTDAKSYDPLTDNWTNLNIPFHTWVHGTSSGPGLSGFSNDKIFTWGRQDSIVAYGSIINLVDETTETDQLVPDLPEGGVRYGSGVWTGREWILRGTTPLPGNSALKDGIIFSPKPFSQ